MVRKKRKINLTPYLLIAPFFLVFALFMLYPLVYSFLLSFSSFTNGQMSFIGLQNFKDLFADPVFFISMENVFIFLIVQVPVMLILATLIATFLNSSVLRWKPFFRMGVFLPVLIDLVTYSIVFSLIFNNDYGILNILLKDIGLHSINWLSDPLWAKIAIIISITWRWTGYNAIIILGGLQEIDKEIYESALVDGSNAWTTFFKITIPMLKPILLFVAILSTNGTLQLFTEPLILTNGGPSYATQTVILYLYQNAFTNFKFGLASAGAYVIAVIIILLSLLQMKLTKGGQVS